MREHLRPLAGSAAAAVLCVAVTAPIPAAGAAPSTLFDQTSFASETAIPSTSQDTPATTSEAADDFVVQPGARWTVVEIDVPGRSDAGFSTFNISIYADAGGLPGELVSIESNLPSMKSGSTWSITEPSPVVLGPGHYWLSVQADVSGGTWSWLARTRRNRDGAAWRNPAGGLNPACTGWTARKACLPATKKSPDQVFRIAGFRGHPTG